MGRGGSWTRIHYSHLAEAMLAATEDPIIGIDQRSTDYQVKLYNNFCDLNPSPGKTQYSKRSMAAAFSTSKKLSAEIASFHAAVSFVNALEPTGGCTPDQVLSLMIARHLGRMQGASIDYALKDTPHADWDFSGAHRILRSHPKWQGQSGPIGDLCGGNTVTGSSSAAAGTGGSFSDVRIADDDSPERPSGRKRAKKALFQSQAVAGAMRAVAASMAASASSIAKSADAQNERNGIMVFAGKVDANDIEASEFFALKRKLHLHKARSEVEALSPVASAVSPPSTGGSSAAGDENNDFNNNSNKSSENNNRIQDDDDDGDSISPQ
jgi:hypothetical protein